LECALVVGAMPPRGMHGPLRWARISTLLPRRTRTWRPEV
jgi:hypothetical protein